MTWPGALQHARFQQRSKHDVAVSIYLQTLAQIPDEPNAIDFLGILRHEQVLRNELIESVQGWLVGASRNATST